MRKRTIALLWTAALLGGCGTPPADRTDRGAANVVVADNGKPLPAASPTSRPAPAMGDLPTAFQGHWGRTLADCDISRPDAPGLMKVHGDTIDFHDTTERVRALRTQGGYHVAADVDASGGGRHTQGREALTLEVGGTRLLRTTPRGALHYEHC